MKVKITGLDGGDAQAAAEYDDGGEYDGIPQEFVAPPPKERRTQRTLAAGLMESTADGADDTSGCRDFRRELELKQHAASRPLWVCPDGRIVLEASSPVYAQALDLLVAISEPVSRTRHMQEYQLTQYSLYAGASMGLRTQDITAGLERFSKCGLPEEVRAMVAECTERYGKVKLILRNDRYYIECPGDGAAFDALLHDAQIAEMRDDKIGDLNFLIGPKLYEANWLDLQAKGFIATVSCAEVWCPMTAEFFAEYLRQPVAVGRQLYAMNPSKFRACEYLVRFHEARGDKVIVFSDNVFALKKYAIKLKRPYIYGPTPQHERMMLLEKFKSTSEWNTLFISKVGDTSIDLPEANVIIQVASHFGARRQEAQRLGRILRPKARRASEMFYSTKRQQFLVDQGYAFKVITNLVPDGQDELLYSTQRDQLDLLREVLTDATSAEAQAEDAREAAEVEKDSGGAAVYGGGGVSRKRASMSELSGGDGLTYAETSRRSAPAGPSQRHGVFKQIDKARQQQRGGRQAKAMGCGTSKPGLFYEEKLKQWRKRGGGDLEPVLASGAVALLDAQWIIRHAEAGGVLTHRQALPEEAFLSFADLVEATTGAGGLPVAALSYPWLTKDHPDPRGANLSRVARALKALLTNNDGRITRLGVFWDFGSLHQHPDPPNGVLRTEEQNALFKQGLSCLGTLYSHQHLFVLRLTSFPDGHKAEDQPEGTNVAKYVDRGWCFTEQCWAGLTKPCALSLDLSKMSDGV
ncbi:hypothetical protein EMIHUDRAFT_122935, partial [Emiliania huxleyi CCMP1516]|uniref:Helicase C-terminal domain-containing protein n=2 Tax=Emiliania huxleyi TaxID=2903 RepID=A0A0D3KAY5_EMIH1